MSGRPPAWALRTVRLSVRSLLLVLHKQKLPALLPMWERSRNKLLARLLSWALRKKNLSVRPPSWALHRAHRLRTKRKFTLFHRKMTQKCDPTQKSRYHLNSHFLITFCRKVTSFAKIITGDDSTTTTLRVPHVHFTLFFGKVITKCEIFKISKV